MVTVVPTSWIPAVSPTMSVKTEDADVSLEPDTARLPDTASVSTNVILLLESDKPLEKDQIIVLIHRLK